MKAFLEVPVEDVVEVAAFIERLRVRRLELGEPTDSASVFVDGQGSWTEGELQLLCRRLVDRDDAQAATVRLLDLCAERPGEWVDKATVDAEFPERALQGQLSGLSRMLKSGSLLGVRRDYWPMQWRKEFFHDGPAYQYRVPAHIAQWWLSVRSEVAK